MSVRKTILSILIFLGLLSFYLWDSRRIARQETAKERSERLFDFEVKDIARARLKNANGEFAFERKGDSDWRLTQPIETRGDKDQIEPMLENLRGAKKRGAFDPQGNLKPYGLDDPKTWIEIEGVESADSAEAASDGQTDKKSANADSKEVAMDNAKNGAKDAPKDAAAKLDKAKSIKTIKILFGGTAAQSYQVYAQIAGEKEVFAISDYSKKQCEKTLFSLRDKTLLSAPVDNTVRVEIKSRPRSIVLVRSSASAQDWRLGDNPDSPAADREGVENLLKTISNTKAVGIIDNPTTPVAALALTAEGANMTVTVSRELPAPDAVAAAGVSKEKTPAKTQVVQKILRIGDPARTGDVLCLVEGEKAILLAKPAFLLDLDKRPRDLRNLQIFSFLADRAARIRFTPGSSELVLSREKADAAWAFAEPGEAGPSAKKINQFLLDLMSLRAKSFVAGADEATSQALLEWGFDQSNRKFMVGAFDGATTQGFELGAQNKSDESMYLRRISDGAILSVEVSRIANLLKSQSDLEDRSLIKVQSEKVEYIVFDIQTSKGAVNLTITKGKSSWKAKTGDGKSRVIQPFDITSFLDDLAELEYVARYEPSANDTGRGGLDKPSVKITLRDANKADLGYISAGDAQGFRQIVGTQQGAYLLDLTRKERFSRMIESLLEKVGQAPPEELKDKSKGAKPSTEAEPGA